MYYILMTMLFASIGLIVVTISGMIIDRVEMKYWPENCLKGRKKKLLRILLFSICGVIVSGTFLLFKMY